MSVVLRQLGRVFLVFLGGWILLFFPKQSFFYFDQQLAALKELFTFKSLLK